MSVPDPPWKQKTRPCPFYSQGRCLFSDSCNFLHDVKIKAKNPEIAITSSPTPQSTPALSRTNSITSSSGSPRSLLRARSPPRSPRLSSLLLALGDAIETEEEDDDESDDDFPIDEDDTTRPGDLVPLDAIFGQVSRRPSGAGIRGGEVVDSVEGDAALEVLSHPENVDQQRSHSEVQVVSDVRGHDVFPPLPDTPEPAHESHLVSPVELTMAAPLWYPIGQLPQSFQREDSVDSGYADNWVGPTPFALSPPRKDTANRYSTLSLLSSPFGSPAHAISPKFAPSTHSAWPNSPLLRSSNQRSSTENDQDVSIISLDELDSPTEYAERRRRSGASDIGQDLESTVKQSSISSLHDEDSDMQAVDIPSTTSSVTHSAQPTPLLPSHQVFSLPGARRDEPKNTISGSSHSSEMDVPSPVFSLPPTPPTAVSSPDISSHTTSPSIINTNTEAGLLGSVSPLADGSISSPAHENHDEEDANPDDDDTVLYESYYEEDVVSDFSPHFTHSTASRRTSLRNSVQKIPAVLPSTATSPTGSTTSTSSISLLKPPPHKSPVVVARNSEFPADESPRIAATDNTQDVQMDRRFSREGPLSADWPRGSRPVSPNSTSSPALASSMPSSPSSSKQPPVFEVVPQPEIPESRRSSKVPFGFRYSVAAKKRDSLNAPRPGSAPPARHRPPALVGIGSSRSNSLNDQRLDLVSPTESIPSAGKLRPLRLSILLNSPASSLSFNSIISPSPLSSGMFSQQTADITPATSHPPASPSVQSDHSLSNKPHLSPSSAHSIPSNFSANTFIPTDMALSLDGSDQTYSRSPSLSTTSAPWPHASSPINSYASHRLSHIVRSSSRLSEPIHSIPEDDGEDYGDYDEVEQSVLTVREQAVASAPPYIRPSSAASFVHEPFHAIATPRPTLLFAIASDSVDEVRKVLESGEAGPNDDVGPQSALAFALTANSLKHKTDIVKVLLAHGANPSSLRAPQGPGSGSSVSSFSQASGADSALPPDVFTDMDPATRYYIARADAPQTRRTSSLIHRSFFRPLTKVRYDLVGQDRALEQLFRVLSMPTMAPIVVLLCGPSGHGKSLLARRFGSLLDVPTHTVNMTTLRSTRDIWRSYSMSPYEQEQSDLMLTDFLMENEGKRCVVVLDEIEKTENETILSSLLMPWELGRVSFEAGHRHVDCSKVIWLGTSNIGHDMVFEHQASRPSPDEQMSRDEYVDLMKLLRPKASDRLGPSLLSRITTVLPFVPFTSEEKMAIASEALFTQAPDARTIPAATVEKLVKDSLQSYVPAEGARSLYRAVSTLLLDTL